MSVLSQTQLVSQLNSLQYNAQAIKHGEVIFEDSDEKRLNGYRLDLARFGIALAGRLFEDVSRNTWCLKYADLLDISKMQSVGIDAAKMVSVPAGVITSASMVSAMAAGPANRGGYVAPLNHNQQRIMDSFNRYAWVAHPGGGIEYDPRGQYRSDQNIMGALKELGVSQTQYGSCDSSVSRDAKAAFITDEGIAYLSKRGFKPPSLQAVAAATAMRDPTAAAAVDALNQATNGVDHYPFVRNHAGDMVFDNKYKISDAGLRAVLSLLKDAGAVDAKIENGALIVPKKNITGLAGNGMRVAKGFHESDMKSAAVAQGIV